MARTFPEHPSAAADLATLDRETARLLETVGRLSAADLSEPSQCAGWSRAHVVSHLIANAPALANVVRSAVDGADVTMYASNEARDADIESGTSRTPAQFHADLQEAAGSLRAELDRLRPEHASAVCPRTPGGFNVRVGNVPYLRLREVTFHHADLLAGYGFDDIPADLVEAFLADELTSNPDVDLVVAVDGYDPVVLGSGGVTISGSPGAVLGWMGRGLTEGVRGDGPLPARNEG
ncbi:maleylpyruvate isomerase family mycothiol-dependent enzyme [Luteipulveratus mongoliensis]|uniref:Mycothiol-dependent maleylpyruvate isomerase metal-binding domain-containing protein n=1 Tax=Luteipulveratus mongoliensis TaxID=571913 RepID=A0A0K1JJP0_9MICO|nr:maleylpyruvate isomerase family mycothiol-dependent enzyme [Luteipulveratus mongoliensis]AKU16798.1 hypothetical protein VV02_14510 [Luteipulveratus mongoliensis]